MNMHICAIVCACDLCIALACVSIGACAFLPWKQNELLIMSLKIKSNESVWYAKCFFFVYFNCINEKQVVFAETMTARGSSVIKRKSI